MIKTRAKRYIIDGEPMKTTELTYKFAPTELLTEEIRAEIKQAFEVWSEYTDLTFTETKSEHVNFRIM